MVEIFLIWTLRALWASQLLMDNAHLIRYSIEKETCDYNVRDNNIVWERDNLLVSKNTIFTSPYSPGGIANLTYSNYYLRRHTKFVHRLTVAIRIAKLIIKGLNNIIQQ